VSIRKPLYIVGTGVKCISYKSKVNISYLNFAQPGDIWLKFALERERGVLLKRCRLFTQKTYPNITQIPDSTEA